MFADSFSFETFEGTKWTAPYRLRLPEACNDIFIKGISNAGQETADLERLFARCEDFACAVWLISQVFGDLAHMNRDFGLDPGPVVQHPVNRPAGHPRSRCDLFDCGRHWTSPLPIFTLKQWAERQKAAPPNPILHLFRQDYQRFVPICLMRMGFRRDKASLSAD